MKDERKRKRDSRGWRVPRKGTMSRKIYDYIVVDGMRASDIAIRLGISVATVSVLSHRFRHPDLTNSWEVRRRLR